MRKYMVWFDFDNAPHVPVLLPVVKEMINRGYETIITARDKSETKELLYLNNENFKLIGKSFPKNKLLKLYYTFGRAFRLIYYLKKVCNKKINLSVNHCSRSALLASWLMRIPSVSLGDYEYANSIFQNIFATRSLMPNVFETGKLKTAGLRESKIDFYPGIKEQIYINQNIKNEDILESLGIDKYKIIILFRPPSETAHYHNRQSEIIMRGILDKITEYKEKIFVILLPRTKEQGYDISNFIKLKSIPHMILNKPLDGINLILNSDLVFSGGGTITREAAVLGVPSYSFFQGKKGAVDEFLERRGRLNIIYSIKDIENIKFEKKKIKKNILFGNQKKIISSICDRLEASISFSILLISVLSIIP